MRALTRVEWQLAAGLAILIWCACAPPARPTPIDFSGAWAGTTSQGRPITFTVSADLRVTALTVGYAFDGCSATLNVPANVPLINTSGTASAVVTDAPGPGSVAVVVRFLFPSAASANGTAQFGVPGCGSATATWTASKP
jgi:hypothetical protein